jgi:hypothetical protein
MVKLDLFTCPKGPNERGLLKKVTGPGKSVHRFSTWFGWFSLTSNKKQGENIACRDPDSPGSHPMYIENV